MENVAQKKSNAIQGLQNEGVVNSHEKVWVSDKLEEFGIMLCGSARVGKSTLINAICGKSVAKTSASLNSCTAKITKYSMEVQYKDTNSLLHKAIVSFWDTPGIEDWTEKAVKEYVFELVGRTNPICMIYCASPGTLANTKVIQWLCEACRGCKIFFALVCTNKYAGTKQQRDAVLTEFQNILKSVAGQSPQTIDNILCCPKIGLVTSVNSELFDNGEWRKEKEGVNELCFAIMRELDEEKLREWCVCLLDNRDFWTIMEHKIVGFFKDTLPGWFSSATKIIDGVARIIENFGRNF